MEFKKQYLFMENDDWYYFDRNEKKIKLTNLAPEQVKESYKEYLEDEEHAIGVMMGIISDEEDDEYEEKQEASKLLGVNLNGK